MAPRFFVFLSLSVATLIPACRTSCPPIGDAPPGCVRLNDSLWIDARPLQNIDYWEYLGWVMLVYGHQSPEFQAAFPDTSGLGLAEKGYFSETDTVLQHKTYFVPKDQMEEILTRITYAQLAAYTRWRTDRVYEKILTDKKIIPQAEKPSPAHFFSVEKYLSGQYSKTPAAGQSLPEIPAYSLPAEVLSALHRSPQTLIQTPVRNNCRYMRPEAFRSFNGQLQK